MLAMSVKLAGRSASSRAACLSREGDAKMRVGCHPSDIFRSNRFSAFRISLFTSRACFSNAPTLFRARGGRHGGPRPPRVWRVRRGDFEIHMDKIGREQCRICMTAYDDAMVTRCDHYFARRAHASSIQHKKQCPLCKAPVTRRELRVDERMRALGQHLPQRAGVSQDEERVLPRSSPRGRARARRERACDSEPSARFPRAAPRPCLLRRRGAPTSRLRLGKGGGRKGAPTSPRRRR